MYKAAVFQAPPELPEAHGPLPGEADPRAVLPSGRLIHREPMDRGRLIHREMARRAETMLRRIGWDVPLLPELPVPPGLPVLSEVPPREMLPSNGPPHIPTECPGAILLLLPK